MAPNKSPRLEERGLGALDGAEVIKYQDGGRLAVVLGRLKGEGESEAQDCLVELIQKAACTDAAALVESLPSLDFKLTNHSGAEYWFYDAAGKDATYTAEVIYPAAEWQVQRKRPQVVALFEETGDIYARLVEPFVVKSAARIGWIDAVCSLDKEKERNLFASDAFIINVDTKWKTHADCASTHRATWKQASWTTDLYLLAISRDATLRTIRDLRGDAGAVLCENMRDALRRCALEVYGVPASKLRIFFHYQPQFYRLHAHCTRVEYSNPGSEVERAHLLTTVADNLRHKPDYYANAILTYKLKEGEGLYNILVSDGRAKDPFPIDPPQIP